MKMCPFNKEGLLAHRLALWVAINVPVLRRLLAKIDNWFKYGKRSVENKWWWDHENIEGRYIFAKSANQRDLKRALDGQGDGRYAVFPPDMQPPPVHDDPFPVDRKEGLRRRSMSSKPPNNS